MIDEFKDKNFLVTGGAGLLGMSLTKKLTFLKHNVVSTYHNRLPPKNYNDVFEKYDFNNYEDCLKATKNIDYVIISAVQASGVSGVLQNPTSTILPNLKIHAGLLEACAENNVSKVIWISSSSVYQEFEKPIREENIDLNSPPYELYMGIGWVYRYLEKLAKYYQLKSNLKIGIIRTANIYGPYDRFDDIKSHVIPALIKRALKSEDPFIVWGHKDTIRDFVYVDDLSNAVLNILHKHCNAEPINFSSGTGISIENLVKIILQKANHKVEPIFDEKKPSAVPYRVLDNTLYDGYFQNEIRTSLESGINNTIKWCYSDEYRE